MAGDRPIDDPEYLSGQIDALRALVLAIAQTMPKEEFQLQGLQRIEMLRTAALATTAADSYFEALDQAETWLRQVSA